MLFPYTYVPHQMEKMQEFVEFTFFEIWCKAPIGQPFHPDLYAAKPDFKNLMSEFGFSSKSAERAKTFYKDIKEIYALFSGLPPQDIDKFKQWFSDNNDIEKICANDPAVNPVRYKDVIGGYPKLGGRLADFYRGLYDQSLLGLAALKNIIGELSDHYRQFFKQNLTGKCPFCGVSDLKGINHTRRDAYDHYLPKCRYPFNSINFRNLVPACHECNSSYKLSSDPVLKGGVRRKAFYPYSTSKQPIEISAELIFSTNTVPLNISLSFGPTWLNVEIDSWKAVYGIEERYKAKLRSPDAQDWLEEFRILNRCYGVKAADHIVNMSEREQFANSNFLKTAYLKGCQVNGVLASIEDAARLLGGQRS